MLPWILCVVLSTAAALLAVKVYLLRKSMDEIRREFAERLSADTNTLISISSGDAHAKRLASEINAQLRLLREQRPAQPSGASAVMSEEQGADLPVIEGIDVQAGMNYLGGKKHLITALKNFYMLIDNHAHRIESFLKEGMLREATTEVHALKSAALLIGAGELSMRFRRLERYGLEENLEAFKREAPAVIELYRSYKIFLKPLGDKAEGEKKPAAKKDLISILDTIKSAVDHFDIDGVDYAMKQLDEYRLPDECRPHMDALRLCAADVAVEEVLAMAEIIKGIITLLREDAN